MHRHITQKHLLIITQKGKLLKLYCPFKVKIIKSVQGIPAGTLLIVEEIVFESSYSPFYLILNRLYRYDNFLIFINI